MVLGVRGAFMPHQVLQASSRANSPQGKVPAVSKRHRQPVALPHQVHSHQTPPPPPLASLTCPPPPEWTRCTYSRGRARSSCSCFTAGLRRLTLRMPWRICSCFKLQLRGATVIRSGYFCLSKCCYCPRSTWHCCGLRLQCCQVHPPPTSCIRRRATLPFTLLLTQRPPSFKLSRIATQCRHLSADCTHHWLACKPQNR